MEYIKKHIALTVLILMSFSFLIFFYGDILMSPNNYMFSYFGDALKNYANFKYHIQYDNSLTSYNGVFYPYGESLLFTDIHPVIVTFYKLLSFIFPSIGYYSVGLINMQILLSFVVTSIVLYFVFRKFKVSDYTAVFGAFAISVLSSHILLLEYGHWALSYAWAVPFAWLLILNFFEKEKKYKWSVFIAINTLFWFLTHGYQGLSILLFTASIFLVLILINIKNKHKFVFFIKHFAIQVVVPVAVYYFLIIYLDNHSDRIGMPFTTSYVSDINFVLTPNFSFLKPLYYYFYDFSINSLSWGFIGNYIGFSTIIIIIICLIMINKTYKIFKHNYLGVYILVSILVLLYSFGIPFKYNLEYILDYIPAIKQFTGLGRFAWVFYFVITVFAFIAIDKLIKNKNVKFLLVFIAAFIMTLEGGAYHTKISKIIKNPNILKKEHIPVVYKGILDIDVSKYQAVITLPFFIKYGCPYVPSFTKKAGYFYSIIPSFTGLPTLNAVLSRPATDESRKIAQIFSPNNYKKDIKKDFNSKKPFLVLYTKDKLVKQEQEFLNKCKLLKSTKNYELYEIEYNKIFDFNSEKIFKKFSLEKDSMYSTKNCFLSDSSFIICENYDSLSTDKSIIGTGSFSKKKIDTIPIFNLSCKNFAVGKKYNISFWYYNSGYNQAFTILKLTEYNKFNKEINTEGKDPLKSEIIHGNWVYVEFQYKISDFNNSLVLNNGSQKEFIDNNIYIDNLIIREETVDCYQQINDSTLVINNMIYTNFVSK